MGWSLGEVGGRDVGYSVEAECDSPGCTTVIHRGLSHACGDEHGYVAAGPEDQGSCEGYFCAEHIDDHADCGPRRITPEASEARQSIPAVAISETC